MALKPISQVLARGIYEGNSPITLEQPHCTLLVILLQVMAFPSPTFGRIYHAQKLPYLRGFFSGFGRL